MEEVVLPKLGLAMEQGTIVKWLVQEGQAVEQGQPLFEVETDKATAEVESPAGGVMGRILVGEGETRPVGAVVGYLAARGEELDRLLADKPFAKPPDVSSKETDRRDQAGPQATPIARRLAKEKGVDLIGIKGTGPRGRITREDVEALVPTLASAPPKKVRASPAARRAARDAGVSLSEIQHSGPHERILAKDVRAQVKVHTDAPGDDGIYCPSRIEQIMAERTTQSFAQAPHFYLTVEVDATCLAELRQDLLDIMEERAAIRLTHTDLLLRILAKTLTKPPRLNASYEGGHIRLHRQVNLGLAVAARDGLIVPIVRNADHLSLTDLARRRADLTSRAAAGRLALEDFEEGTFTLSNLGMYDIDQFQAILNPPQAAILAVGAIKDRPAAVQGAVRLRPSLFMTLSVDHRVADGSTAALFLQDLKQNLERPNRVLLA